MTDIKIFLQEGWTMDMKILAVDDSMTDIAIIKGILFDYNVVTAANGMEAMEILEKDPAIDIMLLDLNMPIMNGFDVLEELSRRKIARKLATLILTNSDEIENEIKGLEMGALDYIRKPLNFLSLRKRIEVHINLRNARIKLEDCNVSLERTVDERTNELIQTRDITIHALTGLLETRNIETSNHTKRTQWMMKVLCEYLQHNGKYSDILTDSYIGELFSTAPLHDIGKVGIPDVILLKPSKLTFDEFEIMKKHSMYGVSALRYELGVDNTPSFVNTAIEIIGTHHEKYDGSGYPQGLKGKDIPLSGRLMAIIDVYDALVSKRVYKDALDHEDALRIIKEEKGWHFDPDIVDAFVDIESTIKEISTKYIQH